MKLIQMEYQVTYIFPTFYQLTLNDWPLSGKFSMRGEVLKKGMGVNGKKKRHSIFLRCLLRSVCDWQSPSPFSWKPCDPSKNSKAPRSAGNKWKVVAFVTVCHSFPVILAFVSGPCFNTWSYSKLSSTRQSVDEMLKEKRVNVHVVNDLATNNNTDLMYTIFTLLLTSNSDLAINQPKSPIIFPYFRHKPIKKFNAALHWRPPLVRVQVINLPRKTDFPLINYKTKRCVILIHWPTLFLVVDTRSIGSIVRSRSQNMQICHSSQM